MKSVPLELRIGGALLAMVLLWIVGGWAIETIREGHADVGKAQDCVDVDALLRASQTYQAKHAKQASNLEDIEPYFVPLKEDTAWGNGTKLRGI